MLESESDIPEKTHRPFQQMKKKIAICQGIGMARKLGWAVAMGKEDMHCSLGAAPFGFFKNIDFFKLCTTKEGLCSLPPWGDWGAPPLLRL